jgi:hypothetical protein
MLDEADDVDMGSDIMGRIRTWGKLMATLVIRRALALMTILYENALRIESRQREYELDLLRSSFLNLWN